MGSFNRGGGGFNRGGFGGGKRFPPKQMHDATCSECGADCQLPFRPTGDRPVFCSNCFDKQGNGGKPSKFGDRPERSRFGSDKQMHDAVCVKCGTDCQVPFKPMPGKQIFCSNCFGKGGNVSGGGNDAGGMMEQLKMLNAKIDKLMNILAPDAVVEKTQKSAAKKEISFEKIQKDDKAKKEHKEPKEKKEKNKIKAVTKKTPAKKKK
jgi:CxxC-x17-CxxC domain-containing protein